MGISTLSSVSKTSKHGRTECKLAAFRVTDCIPWRIIPLMDAKHKVCNANQSAQFDSLVASVYSLQDAGIQCPEECDKLIYELEVDVTLLDEDKFCDDQENLKMTATVSV